MQVIKPENMPEHFAEAFNSEDIDSLLSLYESEATMVVSSSARVVKGVGAIRRALEEFLMLRGKIVLEPTYCIQAGELALLQAKWRLTGTVPDGQSVSMEGNSVEVYRRQSDGRWLYIIDNPFGGDLVSNGGCQ
jgi:ketosteroid isomerase-like protein